MLPRRFGHGRAGSEAGVEAAVREEMGDSRPVRITRIADIEELAAYCLESYKHPGRE